MANQLNSFCKSIESYEGYGTPNAKTITVGKNPCALRWSKYQLGVKNGFAYFNSYTDGFNACIFDVQSKCLGRTKTGLGPESTILEFCNVFAPSSDGNRPLKYAEFLASRLNLSIYATLKEIYAERSPLKILVVGSGFPVDRESVIKEGFDAVAAYFGSLGADTTVDYVFGTWLLNPIMIKGATGENLDVIKDIWVKSPAEVKETVKQYIKGHHLTMYCYRSDVGNTPTELSEVFMGSVIGQLPILDVSDSQWVSVWGSHELMHGLYHRLNAEILLSPDSVHKKTWKEGYGEIIKSLLPFLPVILRPIPDKPYTPYIPFLKEEDRKNYILNFIYKMINLIQSWASPPR